MTRCQITYMKNSSVNTHSINSDDDKLKSGGRADWVCMCRRGGLIEGRRGARCSQSESCLYFFLISSGVASSLISRISYGLWDEFNGQMVREEDGKMGLT